MDLKDFAKLAVDRKASESENPDVITLYNKLVTKPVSVRELTKKAVSQAWGGQIALKALRARRRAMQKAIKKGIRPGALVPRMEPAFAKITSLIDRLAKRAAK